MFVTQYVLPYCHITTRAITTQPKLEKQGIFPVSIRIHWCTFSKVRYVARMGHVTYEWEWRCISMHLLYMNERGDVSRWICHIWIRGIWHIELEVCICLIWMCGIYEFVWVSMNLYLSHTNLWYLTHMNSIYMSNISVIYDSVVSVMYVSHVNLRNVSVSYNLLYIWICIYHIWICGIYDMYLSNMNLWNRSCNCHTWIWGMYLSHMNVRNLWICIYHIWISSISHVSLKYEFVVSVKCVCDASHMNLSNLNLWYLWKLNVMHHIYHTRITFITHV